MRLADIDLGPWYTHVCAADQNFDFWTAGTVKHVGSWLTPVVQGPWVL